MFARVAKFEGEDEAAMRRFVQEFDTEADPPPGLPAAGFLMLMDYASGRSMGIVFFETEEDLKIGDAFMNAMSPGEGAGARTSVEIYEVGIDVGGR